MARPTLFLLADTGAGSDPGSGARAWEAVAAALGDGFDCVVLELPGPTGEAGAAGVTEHERAEWVAGRIRARDSDIWLIAADGAGGAVAAIVAAWAEAGEHGLIPSAGLLLVGAADDPSPEPGSPGAEGGAAGQSLPHRRVLPAGAPGETAQAIERFWSEAADRVPDLPPAFARLIASDRVSARTRRAMLARRQEPGGEPRALTPAQHALLTAVLARVLPQRGTDLDLAGRIDVELAAGRGDGWRFAELPPDAEAWRRGLDTVAHRYPGFAGLDAAAQDAAIDRIAAGELDPDEFGPGEPGTDADLLTGEQLRLWFTDVQAEAVRVWLSHPAAQAWLRYDGFADGGDGPTKQGFTTTHAGQWEPWQRDWRTGKELQA